MVEPPLYLSTATKAEFQEEPLGYARVEKGFQSPVAVGPEGGHAHVYRGSGTLGRVLYFQVAGEEQDCLKPPRLWKHWKTILPVFNEDGTIESIEGS